MQTVPKSPEKNWLSKVRPAWPFVLLGLIPPLLVLFIIIRNVPNLPFSDEWALTPLVVNFKSGGVRLSDLWAFHNEHRILISRLAVLGLTALTGSWNVLNEVILGWFSVLLTLILLLLLIRQTVVATNRRVLLYFLASCLLFNLLQWQNWVWGFQLAWFVVNLFCVGALWLLARYPGRWLAFGGALGLTFLATLTLASGFFFAFPVTVLFLLNRREWSWRYALAWGVFFTLFLGLYLQGLAASSGGGWLAKPLQSVYFLLAFVGAPLGGESLPVAAIFGFIGLTVAGFLIFRLWRQAAFSWRTNLPWLALLLCVLANGLVAANSRVLLDLEIAVASRYVTISGLFWLSLAVLVGQNLPIAAASRLGKSLAAAACVGLALILLLISGLGTLLGLRHIEFRTATNRATQAFLYDYGNLPDGVTELIFASEQTPALKNYLYALDQADESFFKQSKEDFRRATQTQWEQTLGNRAFSSLVVPASKIEVIAKSAKLENPATLPDGTQEFTRSGKQAVRLTLLQLNNLSAKPFDPSQKAWLEITAGEVWYVQLEWQDGDFAYLLPLYPFTEDGTKTHYRAFVPEAVSRANLPLNLVLFYKTGRELRSSFKVVLHTPA